ncbi:unnamed protein product [Rotaria sordida]|uniref:Uncharacterized protein n=1 Tax=Rotaria sordida TaxID=392033 RepID=A0A814XA87_9BILA|nr:unnamed protein product [Rotaria sordida]
MYILGESILCRTTTTTLPDATSLAYINSRCASSDTYWDLNLWQLRIFLLAGYSYEMENKRKATVRTYIDDINDIFHSM